MKVDLAYPWTDESGKEHAPDTTVTVEDAVGYQLIRDGSARPNSHDGGGGTGRSASRRPAKRSPKKVAVKAAPTKPAAGNDTPKEA